MANFTQVLGSWPQLNNCRFTQIIRTPLTHTVYNGLIDGILSSHRKLFQLGKTCTRRQQKCFSIWHEYRHHGRNWKEEVNSFILSVPAKSASLQHCAWPWPSIPGACHLEKAGPNTRRGVNIISLLLLSSPVWLETEQYYHWSCVVRCFATNSSSWGLRHLYALYSVLFRSLFQCMWFCLAQVPPPLLPPSPCGSICRHAGVEILWY